jgi:hypothetical protein
VRATITLCAQIYNDFKATHWIYIARIEYLLRAPKKMFLETDLRKNFDLEKNFLNQQVFPVSLFCQVLLDCSGVLKTTYPHIVHWCGTKVFMPY